MSLAVEGGTYYRSYDGVFTGSIDGVSYKDPTFPATTSPFHLDKFEVTVGRFRAFVNAKAGIQGNPPELGAGAHPRIAGSGWDSAWNPNLPATGHAGNDIGGNCDATYRTWTEAVGPNENKPMNCISWYDSFAFCAWDGGRLPTEAEWNFAAAGGAEQRRYPWGSQDPGPDATRAIYGCYYNGAGTCTDNFGIAAVSSAQDVGKWGHVDLAGSVQEWLLDYYSANYPVPCTDCANLVASGLRVARGGYFESNAASLLTLMRLVDPVGPFSRKVYSGVRCARDP